MKQLLKCCGGCTIYFLWAMVITAQPNIKRVEYYIDNDPGYGKAKSVSFTAGNNLSNLTLNIDPSTLTTGIHIIGIRAQDANNTWSHDNRWLFAKPYVPDTTKPGNLPNITRVEYYLDNDPGYGKATPVNIAANAILSNETINVDPSVLMPGIHVLGIRARDAKGAWSLDNRWIFAKPFAADTTKPTVAPRLSVVEYYIDNDPGYGKATAVKFPAGTNLSNVSINIDPAALTSGIHMLGIRAKDVSGAWCQDNKWLFAKPYPTDSTRAGAVPDLKIVEYYFDKDPGYGKGIPVAIKNSDNLANVALSVNISGLNSGIYKLFIRSKDAKNSWSLDNEFVFNVSPFIPPPSIVVNSIASDKLCQKDSVNVSYDATGTYNQGNKFNVELSDVAGGFSNPTIIGTFTGTGNSIIKCFIPSALPAGTQFKIRVNSTNPAITGLPTKDVIKISKLPSPVITPPGTLVIREGDSVKLATSLNYSKYLWSTAATTPTIQVKKFGAYSVKVTDSNACSATSAPVQVNVTPVITASGAVTNLCPGSVITLKSSAANSYKWNTSATTQSIVVNAAGTYYVVANGGGKGDTSARISITYRSCGKPGLLSTTNISVTSATLGWGTVACAKRYQLQYRKAGSTAWSDTTLGDVNTYRLNGLSGSTKYEWQVRTVCLDSPFVASSYSPVGSFTTSDTATIAASAFSPDGHSVFTMNLYPNPTNQNATLLITGSKTKATVLITDIAGRVLWQHNKVYRNTILPVERVSAGTYLVVIKHDDKQEILKLVKN